MRWGRFAVRVGWLLAATPATFLVVQVLHAVHLRVHIGHWPVVYVDTASSFLLWVHEYCILLPTLWAAVLGVPTWVALAAIVAATVPRLRLELLRQGSLAFVGLVALVLFWVLDPLGYVEWYLD